MSMDAPVSEIAATLGDLWQCVIHPAFRIGFLDARDGRPFDHDKILQRIDAETPAGALKRLGWKSIDLFAGADIFGKDSAAEKQARRCELAQYRYEEGRMLFREFGVRCKAWGHPDFPPAQVRAYLITRVEKLNQKGE